MWRTLLTLTLTPNLNYTKLLTTVTAGTISDLVYKLGSGAPDTWEINQATGELSGEFTSRGIYKIDLIVVDKGGAQARLERITFDVKFPGTSQPPPRPISLLWTTGWNAR